MTRDPYKYYFFKCGRERLKNNLYTLSDRIRGTVAGHGSERRKRVCEDKKIFGRKRFREVTER